jgi:hypothetical protein
MAKMEPTRIPAPPLNAYTLVGRCLAPTLTDAQRFRLFSDLAREDIRWDDLLAEANRQQCASLWYVRLKTHDLLDCLPADLRKYLVHIHAVNRARNRQQREGLKDITRAFDDHQIPVIFLTGTAAFAQNLYADGGVRCMGTMELLVPPDRIHTAERTLLMNGYIDDPRETLRVEFPARQIAPQSLQLYHLKKNLAVRIHTQAANGYAGRALKTETVRQTALAADYSGLPVRFMEPTRRLLANALNATLPHRQFLRGCIRLSDLAEFTALADHYRHQLNMRRFWVMVDRHDLLMEISTYCRLAGLLMPTAAGLPQPQQSQWHVQRILHQGISARTSPGWRQKVIPLLWQLTSRAYGSTRKPDWIWRHPCHGSSEIPLDERLACFAGRLFGRSSLHKKPCGVKTG